MDNGMENPLRIPYQRVDDVVAYSFEGEIQCLECVPVRYLETGAVDREGNPVRPVFRNELQADDVCGGCLTVIDPTAYRPASLQKAKVSTETPKPKPTLFVYCTPSKLDDNGNSYTPCFLFELEGGEMYTRNIDLWAAADGEYPIDSTRAIHVPGRHKEVLRNIETLMPKYIVKKVRYDGDV